MYEEGAMTNQASQQWLAKFCAAILILKMEYTFSVYYALLFQER